MWNSVWCWFKSGDWKPSFDGIAAIVVGIIGLVAIIKQTRSSERSVRKQLEAERSAREEDSRRERYGTTAVLRSEIISVWEGDLSPLSSAIEQVTLNAGSSLLLGAVHLPQAPRRYFPVFERCSDRVGLLSRESISLVIRFYKTVGELILAWEEYNRCPEPERERFADLVQTWKGLQNGYLALLQTLDTELREDVQNQAR